MERGRRLRLLLDTHALIWWTINSPRLSRAASEMIADPARVILFSSVSTMEICTKHRLGKLPEASVLARAFEAEMAVEGFIELPLTARHTQLAGNMLIANKDPFDRMLIAQSILEGIPLVSNEAGFDMFGVSRIW